MAPVADEKLAIYADEEVARAYDRRWSGARGAARDRRKRRALEVALAHLGPVQSVLDVPCGTGRFTEHLAAGGRAYVGADAAAAMLRAAAARRAGARFVAADLARLPFADRSFDAAVCIRLMHLVRDAELRAAFLRELARVTRIGVIVDCRHDRSLRVWWGRVRARIGLRARPPNAHSHAALRAELAAAGLEVAAFVPVRRVPFASDKIVIAARNAAHAVGAREEPLTAVRA